MPCSFGDMVNIVPELFIGGSWLECVGGMLLEAVGGLSVEYFDTIGGSCVPIGTGHVDDFLKGF